MASKSQNKQTLLTPLDHDVFFVAKNAKVLAASDVTFPFLENQVLDLNGLAFVFSGSAFTGAVKALATAAAKAEGAVRHSKVREILNDFPFLVRQDKEADKRILPSYPVFYTGRIGDPWIPGNPMPGVKLAIGATGSGKSYWITKELKPDVMIRYSEPNEDYDLLPIAFHVNGLKESIEAAILLSVFGKRVAIDSLRGLITELRGAATEGGIIGALYTQVTDINNFVANFGVNVVMTMNPMVKEEVIPTLYDGLAASATATILLERFSVTRSQYRTANGRVIDKHDTTTQSSSTVEVVAVTNVPVIPEESASAELSNLETTRLSGANPSDMDLISKPRTAANFDMDGSK